MIVTLNYLQRRLLRESNEVKVPESAENLTLLHACVLCTRFCNYFVTMENTAKFHIYLSNVTRYYHFVTKLHIILRSINEKNRSSGFKNLQNSIDKCATTREPMTLHFINMVVMIYHAWLTLQNGTTVRESYDMT